MSVVAGAAMLASFERLKETARGKVAQHIVLSIFATGHFLRHRDSFASAQQRRAWPSVAEVLSRSGARGASGAFLSSDKKTSTKQSSLSCSRFAPCARPRS